MISKLKYLIGILLVVIISYFFSKNISKSFDFAGTVEAKRIDLSARIPTVVKSIEVDEGQSIKKDQLLINLSCEDIVLANKLADQNYQRAINLKKTDSISKEAYDQIQNKKLEIDTKLSWCEIKSPIDGVVLTRYLEPSEWVNPGTKILTIANLKELWTFFYVSQELMSKLKLGISVIGKVPEIDKTFNGTIVKINEEAEFTPKNIQTQTERTRLVFGVKVLFNNEEGLLKPGMTILSSLNENK